MTIHQFGAIWLLLFIITLAAIEYIHACSRARPHRTNLSVAFLHVALWLMLLTAVYMFARAILGG